MKTAIITENEIQDLKIASLPTRPTSPEVYGGKGYTAKEMKEAFDKLPLYIVERLNSLIEDVELLYSAMGSIAMASTLSLENKDS